MVCTERADQQSKKRVNSRDKLVADKNLPVEIGKVIFFLVAVLFFCGGCASCLCCQLSLS